MKFSFIVPVLYRSGGIRVIDEYTNTLIKLGHEAKIYMPKLPYDHYKGEISFNKFLYFYYNLTQSFRNKNMIEKFYNGDNKFKIVNSISDKYIHDADFVIATAWPTAYSVINLSKSKGTKIYFIQGYEIWNSNKNTVDNSYKLNLNQFTTSQFLKNELNLKFGVNPVVINLGLNTDKFKAIKKDYYGTIHVVFLYSDEPFKNTKMAIDVAIQINKSDNKNVKFIAIGNSKTPELPDFIKYVYNPTDEDLVNIYEISNIFLYTSKYEGYGLPPMEAMSCKSVPLSTTVGAVPEYIKHGKTGFLFDDNDSNGMSNCIIKLTEDRELLKKISEEGCNYIQQFDWNKTIQKFLEFVNSLKLSN